MTQNEKAVRVRQEVERMEQERVMVHGIEVKPGQVWAFEGHSGDYPPSRVVSVDHAQRVIRIVDECATPEPDEWGVESFARVHPRLVNPDPGSEAPNDGGPDGAGSCPKPEEPSSDRGARWTDAEFAAEQVALARRQADAARAEARELRAERDRVAAERDRLRVDLDHLHVGTIDHDRMAALEAQLAETRADAITWKKFGRQAAERADRAASELAETRAALEAARAAVHTPSPGGTDPAPKTRLAARMRRSAPPQRANE